MCQIIPTLRKPGIAGKSFLRQKHDHFHSQMNLWAFQRQIFYFQWPLQHFSVVLVHQCRNSWSSARKKCCCPGEDHPQAFESKVPCTVSQDQMIPVPWSLARLLTADRDRQTDRQVLLVFRPPEESSIISSRRTREQAGNYDFFCQEGISEWLSSPGLLYTNLLVRSPGTRFWITSALFHSAKL